MRKLVYHVATTVDGFIADLRHEVGCFLHEGDHVVDYVAALKAYDTIVMGRRTYEFGVRLGVTDPYPWADTYVCSRTVTAEADLRVTITDEEPATLINRLKEREGTAIYLAGGGELAQSLFDAGLIDELILKVNPVVLGSGVPLAPRLASPKALRLRSTKVHAGGVAVHHYEVVA
jgi:dihydrofolate reductase